MKIGATTNLGGATLGVSPEVINTISESPGLSSTSQVSDSDGSITFVYNVPDSFEKNEDVVRSEMMFYNTPLTERYSERVYQTVQNIQGQCAIDYQNVCPTSAPFLSLNRLMAQLMIPMDNQVDYSNRRLSAPELKSGADYVDYLRSYYSARVIGKITHPLSAVMFRDRDTKAGKLKFAGDKVTADEVDGKNLRVSSEVTSHAVRLRPDGKPPSASETKESDALDKDGKLSAKPRSYVATTATTSKPPSSHAHNHNHQRRRLRQAAPGWSAPFASDTEQQGMSELLPASLPAATPIGADSVKPVPIGSHALKPPPQDTGPCATTTLPGALVRPFSMQSEQQQQMQFQQAPMDFRSFIADFLNGQDVTLSLVLPLPGGLAVTRLNRDDDDDYAAAGDDGADDGAGAYYYSYYDDDGAYYAYDDALPGDDDGQLVVDDDNTAAAEKDDDLFVVRRASVGKATAQPAFQMGGKKGLFVAPKGKGSSSEEEEEGGGESLLLSRSLYHGHGSLPRSHAMGRLDRAPPGGPAAGPGPDPRPPRDHDKHDHEDHDHEDHDHEDHDHGHKDRHRHGPGSSSSEEEKEGDRSRGPPVPEDQSFPGSLGFGADGDMCLYQGMAQGRVSDGCVGAVSELYELRSEYWQESQQQGAFHHGHGLGLLILAAVAFFCCVRRFYRARYEKKVRSLLTALHTHPHLRASVEAETGVLVPAPAPVHSCCVGADSSSVSEACSPRMLVRVVKVCACALLVFAVSLVVTFTSLDITMIIVNGLDQQAETDPVTGELRFTSPFFALLILFAVATAEITVLTVVARGLKACCCPNGQVQDPTSASSFGAGPSAPLDPSSSSSSAGPRSRSSRFASRAQQVWEALPHSMNVFGRSHRRNNNGGDGYAVLSGECDDREEALLGNRSSHGLLAAAGSGTEMVSVGHANMGMSSYPAQHGQYSQHNPAHRAQPQYAQYTPAAGPVTAQPVNSVSMV